MDNFVDQINLIYESRYPNRKVITSIVGSQTARLQLENGATPGIFISADFKHIDHLRNQGKIYKSTLSLLIMLLILDSRLGKLD